MNLTGYKVGPLIYSSVTTAWATVSSASDADGFFIQAQTSSLLFHMTTQAPVNATVAGAGITLRGTAYDYVEFYGDEIAKNLKVAAENSGSTVHCCVQFFRKI